MNNTRGYATSSLGSQVALSAAYAKQVKNHIEFLHEIRGKEPPNRQYIFRLQLGSQASRNYCLETLINGKPSWFSKDTLDSLGDPYLVFSPYHREPTCLDEWRICLLSDALEWVSKNPTKTRKTQLKPRTAATNKESTQVELLLMGCEDFYSISDSLTEFASHVLEF